MNPTRLQQHFEVFDLSIDATIDDLDENYHHQSLQLHKQKAANPTYVKQKQQEYDDNYYVLLQNFIREECEEGHSLHTAKLAFNDISTRRYDLGFRKRLFTDNDDDDGVVAMKQKSTKELFDLAKERSDAIIDSREFEDDDDDEGWEDEDVDEDIAGTGCYQVSPRTPTRQGNQNEVFEIEEMSGDIFDAPDGSVIVHSVNCQGVWGSGFAAELKIRYPTAYAAYAHWCRTTEPSKLLVGYCLLIRPQPRVDNPEKQRRPHHTIACLFTSVGYGSPNSARSNPGKDDAETISMHTDSALVDLRNDLNKEIAAGLLSAHADMYSPRINAGSFEVPWGQTKKLIEMCFAGYHGRWIVVSKPVHDT